MNFEKINAELKLYLDNSINVMLIGTHGTGKSERCLSLFEEKFGPRSEGRWLYLSAATMDPWVDFVGVPKEVNGKLDLVRPSYINENKLEALIVDEFNRAHPRIRNALMELIQFKSINGRPFPKLKVVWAAINPHDDNNNKYDVDPPDPAQMDRFPIKIQIPNLPDAKFFKDKYGKIGGIAVDWWYTIDTNMRHLVSPRTLEYLIQIYKINGNLSYVVDSSINTSSLIQLLGKNKTISEQIDELFLVQNDAKAREFINANLEDVFIKFISNKPEHVNYFIPKLEAEKLNAFFSKNEQVYLNILDACLKDKNILLECVNKIPHENFWITLENQFSNNDTYLCKEMLLENENLPSLPILNEWKTNNELPININEKATLESYSKQLQNTNTVEDFIKLSDHLPDYKITLTDLEKTNISSYITTILNKTNIDFNNPRMIDAYIKIFNHHYYIMNHVTKSSRNLPKNKLLTQYFYQNTKVYMLCHIITNVIKNNGFIRT